LGRAHLIKRIKMKGISSTKNYGLFFFFIFSIAIVFLGRTPANGVIRYPFSYIFEPVYFVGNSLGSSVFSWGRALVDASSYISEYKDMQKEIIKVKAENEEKILNYQEYESLKYHSSMLLDERKYIEGTVLKYFDKGDIQINIGKEEGVKDGNVVSIGRVFIGVISEVDAKGSLVRLPNNSASNFEAIIVDSNIDIGIEKRLDNFIKSTGVVKGEVNGIVIENMGVNSTVSDGDVVILRDERVGDLYILGTLVGVSKNPASTSKSAVVSPVFDYSNLLTVFVRIK